MDFILATKNPDKLKEMQRILMPLGITVKSEKDFDFPFDDVEENGKTFEENALLKARAATRALQCIALADDSGLCVPALDGAPGVRSARYAGEHGNDKKNRDLLLKNLQNKKDRSAYFVSAVALTFPDGKEIVVEGKTHGRILKEEVGTGGFGYDCIFQSDDLGKSFGEATSEEKNTVSHRYRALQALLKEWKRLEK